VTDPAANARPESDGPPPAATAGALLGAGREAAGLSIDAVAQQLKLAPRQVRALEEDDYTHLPGRTFVRGFVRSYARLVHLDQDKVLGALPEGATAPALEAPTLQQTAPTMGELPTTDHSKPGWMRWAIPVTLAAVVAAAGVYEWLRPAGVARPAATRDTATAEIPVAASAPPGIAGTPLPNPVLAARPAMEAAPPPEPAQASISAPAPAAAPLLTLR
jgi:cytoskeleton protein RodZ